MVNPLQPQTKPSPPGDGKAPAPPPVAPRRREWLRRAVNDDGNTVGQLLRLLLFGVALLLALGAAIAPWDGLRSAELEEGGVADRTIYAPQALTYVSEVSTQQKRMEAANNAGTVSARDTAIAGRQRAQLDAALNRLGEIRATTSPPDEKIRAAQDAAPGLTADEARRLLDEPRWGTIAEGARQLLNETMQQDIRQDDLMRVRGDLPGRLERDPALTGPERESIAALVRRFIQPNYVENPELTRQKRMEAAAAVPPQTVPVQKGQSIVREGEIVTALQREQLEELGLLQPRVNWQALLGKVGLVAILVVLLVGYLYQFNHEVWRGSQLLLLGLTIALPVIAARITIGSQPLWIYAFPIAAAVMLTTVLLNLQLATVVAMMVSILLGLLGGAASGSLEYMVLGFVASLVGAFVVWQADRIATFFWAGVAVGVSVFAVGACFRVANGALDLPSLAQIAMLAALNGGLATVLTFGSFSFLGGLFGITTHLQLLELAHPNQPLLYRLAREAPGTYHHSIVVSNLAESAVELVGGDPLFTRVAVLYHDIGKTLRPTFFIENQANRDNVHDVLDPQQSARIIIDHVTDGVRLAQKARLPEPIVDIIRQHHGTMLIRYFYHRALEQGEEVREADFRYPGPRPQTKEAGVIMLADSVEAAVRASAQSGRLNFQDEPRHAANGTNGHAAPAPARGSKLLELVEQVIEERVKSGQLDDCDLTLRDIDRIKRTFVQVLDGIYHPRIEYPAAPTRRAEEAVAVASRT